MLFRSTLLCTVFYINVREGVEISMSVLMLLTKWCSLVTVSSSKQSLDLRMVNER